MVFTQQRHRALGLVCSAIAAYGGHPATPRAHAQPTVEAHAPAELPIGLVAAPISADAASANTAALVHHRGRRFAQSEAGFAAAVALAPEYDIARFNHACALARLGRMDEARAELTVVLHHDLPSFEARLAADRDVAALRDDVTLSALRAALHARYAEAAATGAPVVVGDAQRACGGSTDPVSSSVQPGAFVRETGRFVPLAPMTHSRPTSRNPYGVAAGLYDPVAGLAMVITSQATYDEVPSLQHVVVQVYDATAHRTAQVQVRQAATTVDGAFAFGNGIPRPVFCTAGQYGVDALDGGIGPDGRIIPGLRCELGRARIHLSDDWWFVRSDPHDGMLFTHRLLRTELGDRELDEAHNLAEKSLVRVGSTLVVASMQSLPVGDLGPRHVVDRLRIDGEGTERLSEGEGPAGVRMGPDGAMYLEVGQELRRYASIDASTYETLPAWVHLSIPRPADCPLP